MHFYRQERLWGILLGDVQTHVDVALGTLLWKGLGQGDQRDPEVPPASAIYGNLLYI